MYNKKETFSKRARNLIRKYSRSEFDEIEKAELNEKLAELAQEQEVYKQANGMNDESQNERQMAFGGPFEPEYGASGAGYSNLNSFNINTSQPNAISSSGGMPQIGQYIPSLVSGAISMFGNYQAAKRADRHTDNMLKILNEMPPAKMQAYMQNPSLLNLEEERSNIRKDFDESKRIAARNIRNTSRGRGEYLSAVTGVSTAIDRNKARAISESQLSESKYNATARERASASNIANRMRADQYNLGVDQNYNQMKMAIEQGRFAQSQPYRDAALQTIPQMTRDINQIYQQDQLIKSLGRDYGYVNDPNRKWWQMPQYQSQYIGRRQG